MELRKRGNNIFVHYYFKLIEISLTVIPSRFMKKQILWLIVMENGRFKNLSLSTEQFSIGKFSPAAFNIVQCPLHFSCNSRLINFFHSHIE